MATIRINRPNEWANINRNYKIYIDGRFAGEIANDTTKEFPTTEGQHTIIAKIDWCSSQEISINVSAYETKCLTVSCSCYEDANSSNLFYYLTIWRKKYLNLNEM